MMNRREVLQKTALVLGYAVTGSTLAGMLNGCKAKPALDYKPQFFNEEQALLISELAGIIIPKTDTPGAKESGVPAFIDGMLFEVYAKDEQESFLKDLLAFDEDAKKTYGDNFASCTPEKQAAWVKKQHDAALSSTDSKTNWGWWSSEGGEKPFILKVKELTLLGFFTSEAGATQVLQHNQVPGPFKGCVPLEEVGKTWAT